MITTVCVTYLFYLTLYVDSKGTTTVQSEGQATQSGSCGKDNALSPYTNFGMNCMSVHDGCLLGSNHVIVPPEGREKVLKLLHDGHPGNMQMKE